MTDTGHAPSGAVAVFHEAVDELVSTTKYWWLLLIGIAEIAIGFWAAGSWKVSVVVLVSWVSAGALIHGIGQIASAFMVRNVGHGAAALDGQQGGA